jgi:hypothetical protein
VTVVYSCVDLRCVDLCEGVREFVSIR